METFAVPIEYVNGSIKILKLLLDFIKFTEMDTDEFLSEVGPWRKSLDYIDPDFYTQVLEHRQIPMNID